MSGSSKKNRIVAKVVPTGKSPVIGDVPAKAKVRFGFKHWRQINFFGVDQVEKSWFISLLERLVELSAIDVADLLGETGSRVGEKLRFHEVDFTKKNVPIKRSEINWLGAKIEEPAADIILQQFHISKALGRVVGFFDAESVFQVVLLDPFHNIQPSKHYDYRVRDTYVGNCELTTYKAKISRLIESLDLPSEVKADMSRKLEQEAKECFGYAIVTELSDDTISAICDVIANGKVRDVDDVFAIGLRELSR